MAGIFDDIPPYSYDPQGFIVAATQPMQPRAGAAPAQDPLAMARGNLSGGPAYQALMSALLGSFNRQPNIQAMEQNNAGIPSMYTPLGIQRSQRVNWNAIPGLPGAPQQMAQPAQQQQPVEPMSLLPTPQSYTE